MGIVIDFIERKKRVKIAELMVAAETAMTLYNSYKKAYPGASIASPEGQKAAIIHREYLASVEVIREMAGTLTGEYYFANKYLVLSRSSYVKDDGTRGNLNLTSYFKHLEPLNPYLTDPPHPQAT